MDKYNVDLSVKIGKMQLKNPIMPSAGTFGYGEEYAEFLNIDELGAVVVNRISLYPKMGNPQHRCIEIAGGAFLNTTGQQNPGVDWFIKYKLPYLKKFRVPIIVNIAGSSIDEYVKITESLTRAGGISGVEVNLACPNLKEGGSSFCANPDTAYQIVKSVREETDLAVIPKLNPAKVEVEVLARACEEAGADAICSGLGLLGMAIDINTRRSKLGKNLNGALGGPGCKPVAIRLAWQASRAVKIPIIGVGGVTNAEDALEFLIAGATAVQIGSYNFIDPRVTIKTIVGIKKYLVEKGIQGIAGIIGSLKY